MKLTVCVSRLQSYFCFALTTNYRDQDSKPKVQFSMLNINFALKWKKSMKHNPLNNTSAVNQKKQPPRDDTFSSCHNFPHCDLTCFVIRGLNIIKYVQRISKKNIF